MKTAQELLRKRSVKELGDISFRCQLNPPAEKPRNKDSWIAPILQRYADVDFLRRLVGWETLHSLRCIYEFILDDDELEALRARAVPQPLRRRLLSTMDENTMERLARLGLAWRDRESWYLSRELLCAYAMTGEEEEALLTADRLYCVMRAAMNYYGLLTAEEMNALLLETGASLPGNPLQTWQMREGLEGFVSLGGIPYYRSAWMKDAEACWNAWQNPPMKDAPWRRATAEQLLSDSLSQYGATEESTHPVFALAEKYHLDPQQAPWLITEAVRLRQQSFRYASRQLLQEGLEDGGVPEELASLVASVFVDSIRLWSAKGRTEREAMTLAVPKVAFSKPCPCGSGVPYGRCHGKGS